MRKFFLIPILVIVGCASSPQSETQTKPKTEVESTVAAVESKAITLSAEEASKLIEEMQEITLEAVKAYRNTAQENLKERVVKRLIKDSSKTEDQRWYVKEQLKIEEKTISILLKLADSETKWREQIGIPWQVAKNK